MNERLQQKCDRMATNYLLLEKTFPFEANITKSFISMIFSSYEHPLDKDILKDINQYIVSNTGLFSIYRGTNKTMLAALLITSGTPKESFDQMLINHDYLKKAGFKESLYFPIANYALLANSGITSPITEIQRYCDEAIHIYQEMKKNHPWLTSGDDYPLAILLASQKQNLYKIEEFYTELNRRGFGKGNGLQMLSHILAFSPESVFEVVERCEALANKMKLAKLPIQSDFYSAIGLIALLKDDQNQLIEQWIEVANCLTNQKKFKWLGKGANVLLASGLVANHYITSMQEKNKTQKILETALTITMETLLAAQIAATVAAVSASMTVATTAAN